MAKQNITSSKNVIHVDVSFVWKQLIRLLQFGGTRRKSNICHRQRYEIYRSGGILIINNDKCFR